MKNIFSLSTGLKTRGVLTVVSFGLGVTALGLMVVRPGFVTTAKAATGGQCIVTVFGQQYDVTSLGTLHPGPKGTTLDAGAAGFFQCGTDMSAAFQAQHGTSVARMAPYIYAAPSATPVPTAAPTSAPVTAPSPTLASTPTPSPVVVPPTPGAIQGGNQSTQQLTESRDDERESDIEPDDQDDDEEAEHEDAEEHKSKSDDSDDRHDQDED